MSQSCNHRSAVRSNLTGGLRERKLVEDFRGLLESGHHTATQVTTGGCDPHDSRTPEWCIRYAALVPCCSQSDPRTTPEGCRQHNDDLGHTRKRVLEVRVQFSPSYPFNGPMIYCVQLLSSPPTASGLADMRSKFSSSSSSSSNSSSNCMSAGRAIYTTHTQHSSWQQHWTPARDLLGWIEDLDLWDYVQGPAGGIAAVARSKKFSDAGNSNSSIGGSSYPTDEDEEDVVGTYGAWNPQMGAATQQQPYLMMPPQPLTSKANTLYPNWPVEHNAWNTNTLSSSLVPLSIATHFFPPNPQLITHEDDAPAAFS